MLYFATALTYHSFKSRRRYTIAYRSSTSTAAAAFAIATSASSNPRDEPTLQEVAQERNELSSPATIRVLNVLRYF